MNRPDTNKRLEFIVRSSMLDRPRRLVIDPEYLEFDDKDAISEEATLFDRLEIASLRYGVKAIRGYRFRIGRIYCIDVQDVSRRVIKIRLKSLYRVRRRLLGHKYEDILNALLRTYFHDIMREQIKQVKEGQSVDLLGVNLNSEGVLFDEKVGRIGWNFIGTKRFWHYYTIFSEEIPEKYRAFTFIDDWNAAVLQGVIETLKKAK
jgi:hypothetical protein